MKEAPAKSQKSTLPEQTDRRTLQAIDRKIDVLKRSNATASVFAEYYDSPSRSRIERIELYFINVDVRREFSGGSWPARYQCMVRVLIDGLEGWGELTLTNLDVAVADAEKFCGRWIGHTLKSGLALCSTSMAGIPDMYKETIEIALVDLLGRRDNKTALDVLQLSPFESIAGLDCILERNPTEAARKAAGSATSLLKIKLFGDKALDTTIVRRVRESLPDGAFLVADVNEGYFRGRKSLSSTETAELRDILLELRDIGLNACEDPAPVTLQELSHLQNSVPGLALIPDYRLRPAYNLYDVIDVNPEQIYNLHPHCMGSIVGTLLLAARIRVGGARVMIGDNSLIGAGCTAWQQIAGGIGAIWCEAVEKPLEYSSSFTDCVVSAPVQRERNGQIVYQCDLPGFGLSVDSRKLARNSRVVRVLSI